MQYRFFHLYPIQFLNNCWKKICLIRKFFHKKKTIENPDYIYYEKCKKRFMESFIERNSYYNRNVDYIFYNKQLFQDTMKDDNNHIEKKWRTRILMQNTPRGNIIMLYDAFKQAFVYYSDSKNIPYYILNTIAMQYVIKFSCRDFFIDNQITQEVARYKLKDDLTLKNLTIFDSALIPIYYEEDKKEENKKPNKSQVLHNNPELPFAKFKNYNSKVLQNKVDTMRTDNKGNFITRFINYVFNKFYSPTFWTKVYKKIFLIPELEQKAYISYDKEHVFNKFIHLGKFSNFQFLQKPKTNVLNGFYSELLENVCSEAAVQKEVMSYSSYKKFLQNQVSDNTSTKKTTLVKSGTVSSELSDFGITSFGVKEAYEAGIYDVARSIY